jgi:hypothetical protein
MMDEPERLLDQKGSALARTLLQEGRDYQGSEHLRDRTLAAVGLAGSAGLALSISGWLAARSWMTKVFLALSTAGLLVAIPMTYVLVGRGAAAVAPPAPAVSIAPAPVLPVPTSPGPTVASHERAWAAAPSSSPSAPSSTSVPAVAPRARAGSSDLRAELAALDAVRSTLADNDAPAALTSLGTYFRSFPRGRLHLEAEALRIDTLAKAGRPEDARRYAEDFLRRHPNSVLTARVRPYAQR